MEKSICTQCGKENPANYKYCFGCGYELPKANPADFNQAIQENETEKKVNRSRIFGFVIGALAFALAFFAVQQIFFKPTTYNKAMMQIASELNKSCPIMVDAETRLDNTVALGGNVFQYNYTLVNIEKATADTAEMKKYLEPRVTNFVKTNPQMKIQRVQRTTINYFYKDKSGTYLFLISVTPDKYE